VDVMTTILRSPRLLLLLHQVHLRLRRQTHLLRLHLHPRQSPPTLLSPKVTRLRLRLLRLRLPRLRLQLLPRPSRLLRLPPPKPVAVVVATVATCTVEASTYLGVCSYWFTHCLPRATFFYQKGQAGACGTVHSDGDLICAIGECSFERPTQSNSLSSKIRHCLTRTSVESQCRSPTRQLSRLSPWSWRMNAPLVKTLIPLTCLLEHLVRSVNRNRVWFRSSGNSSNAPLILLLPDFIFRIAFFVSCGAVPCWVYGLPC
jgi:hypothetical protein